MKERIRKLWRWLAMFCTAMSLLVPAPASLYSVPAYAGGQVVELRHYRQGQWNYYHTSQDQSIRKTRLIDTAKHKAVKDEINGQFDKVYSILTEEIGIYNGMPADRAYFAIVNWLKDSCTCDRNYRAHRNNDKRTSYKTYRFCNWLDVVESRMSVCNGYAETVYLMCWMCKIPVRYLVGHRKDNKAGSGTWGLHAWNRVRLNGTWYYCDISAYDSGKRKNRKYLLSKALLSEYRVSSSYKKPDLWKFCPEVREPLLAASTWLNG